MITKKGTVRINGKTKQVKNISVYSAGNKHIVQISNDECLHFESPEIMFTDHGVSIHGWVREQNAALKANYVMVELETK